MKDVVRVLLLGLLCLGSDQAWSQMLSDIRLQPKIVGPPSAVRPAADSQFGSVVAIFFDLVGGQGQICSGTVLTSKLILTAGHCGCGIPHTYSVNARQFARREVPSPRKGIDGAPVLFDQRVCRNGFLAGGNDLALIKLADEINLNGRTAVEYPFDSVWSLRSKLVKGTKLTAVGYGVTSANVVGTRQRADIPIQSFGCEERALSPVCAPFVEMILAESPGPAIRTDTCGGDSGGPVFRFVDGVPHLVAVTSRAAPGSQDNPRLHCGGGGIYTLVGRNSVHQWLQDNGVPESKIPN
jgi:secreted trypsin-like serine protease